jgi:hypothetical protein
MTLVPGATPQLRKRAKRDWTRAKAAKFLGVLAETCNVSEACRVTKTSMTSAYRHRKKDAAFRAGWLDAIATAYSRLEMILLERTFNGTERIVTRKDGSVERMMEYPNHIGLQLLKMHRETAMEADAEMAPEDIEEIRERLVRKLQRLKARDEAKEAGSRELRGGATAPDGDVQGRGRGAAAPDHQGPDA